MGGLDSTKFMMIQTIDRESGDKETGMQRERERERERESNIRYILVSSGKLE